ncbi:hypothetical protein PVAND_001492 [Polypedilum vanderplanki]|uniref:Uncharacterized protein n=1 Tax=Polypedilum vanderplanki TaxID=319348 RepID=A0A9J6BNL1_POLVA|nr:hypothetical protein PVAND_001492 [Polypedilum vanderplanki]
MYKSIFLINLLFFIITCSGMNNNLYQTFFDAQDEFISDSWDNHDESENENRETIDSFDENFNMHRRDLPFEVTTRHNDTDNDISNRFINNSTEEKMSSNLLSSIENNGSNSEAKMRETLNQILEELEMIKATKLCADSQPDGMNCDLTGAWNSGETGLNIELMVNDNKLLVNLAEKAQKKSNYFIDANWKCSGHCVHQKGGPFYFHCTNHPLQSMAIFHGICKHCSGFDTIFGEWIFQHVPKDCRQLLTFSETKRDVFYKDILHHGKNSTAHVNLNKSNNTMTSNAHASKISSKARRNSSQMHKKLMQNWN